jgi:hypothetical protein
MDTAKNLKTNTRSEKRKGGVVAWLRKR